jgi:hypothetical protein
MNKQIIRCFLLTVLLGTLGILPSVAQQYFNKNYTVDCAQMKFTSVAQRGSKYYVTNACLDSINHISADIFYNTNGIKFAVFDSSGNLLTSKLLQRADKKITNSTFSNTLYPTDSGFLLAVSCVDTALDIANPSYYAAQTTLIHFDTLGNVLWMRDYARPYCTTYDPTNHILMDLKPDGYGHWLMLSSLICYGKVVFCLRKLDKDFNEIWVKDFSTSGMHNKPKHLLIEPDGYTMTGSIDNGNSASPYTNYYASLIIKCDTAGAMLWSWQNTFDITNLQYTINDIIRTKDNGYIYCGSGRGNPIYYTDGSGHWSGIVVWGYVEKLDSTRKSVWQTKLGYTDGDIDYNEQRVIKELPDGNILIAGGLFKFFEGSTTKGYPHASLTKLNPIDGSIIWQRIYNYQPDTLSSYLYDMRSTEDGGFILAGYTLDNLIAPLIAPYWRGWLIKVDSNGCEGGASCNPTAIIPVNPTANYINIYPNPSTSDYELQYEVQNKEPLQLVISDITGRILLQTNLPAHQNSYHIHAANWAAGVYLYQLSQKGTTTMSGKLVKY